MTASSFAFYFFIASAAISAFGILCIRNVLKGALLLLVCLLSVAALYVLAFAEFLAVTQILVYAGGVLVVIIFGIMLTTKLSGGALIVTNTNIFSGAFVSFALLALMLNLIPGTNEQIAESAGHAPATLETIGMNFMTSHSLAFEISGLLLLVALLGAAVIASFMKMKQS